MATSTRTKPINSGYTILNGSSIGSNDDRFDVWVEYKVVSQDIAGNKSTIKAYFYAALRSGESSSTRGSSGLNTSFSVGGKSGTTVSNGSYDFTSVDKINVLGSFSGTISHDDDGTKKASIKGEFETKSTYIAGGTISKTITLPAIPRESKPTVSADSVVMFKSVKITTNRASDKLTHTLTYKVGSVTGTIATKVGASYEWTVPWFYDIKSATCTITCKTYNGSTQIGSAKTVSLTVKTPEKSTVTAFDAQMGKETKISIERHSKSLTHKLYYTFDGSKVQFASGVAYSYTWNVPDLAAKCDDATWGSCVVTCETYNGTALIGSDTDEITLSVPDPTVPEVSKSVVYIGTDSVKVTTPRKSSNFKHYVTYEFGSAKAVIHTGQDRMNSYWTWEPAYSLASQIPDAVSGECTITCVTYNGTAKVGTKTVKLQLVVPENSKTKPSFTYTLSPYHTGTVAENNPIVNHGDYVSLAGKYIKSVSKIKAVFDATSEYSKIKNYTVKIGTFSTKTEADNTVVTGSVPTSGKLTVTLRVTDQRGFYTEKTETITALDYSPPELKNVSVYRCDKDGKKDDDGTYVYISAKRSYSKLSGQNQLSGASITQGNLCRLRARYRTTGSSSYGEWIQLILPSSLSTDSYSGLLNSTGGGALVVPITDSYQVQVQVVDSLSNYMSRSYSIPTAQIDLSLNNNKAAFGKYAEEENALQVAKDWKLHLMGDAEIDGKILSDLTVAHGDTTSLVTIKADEGQTARLAFNSGDQYIGEWYASAYGNLVFKDRTNNISVFEYNVPNKAFAQVNGAYTSGTVTVYSGAPVTLSSATLQKNKFANVCFFRAYIKTTAKLTAGTGQNVLSVPSDFTPATYYALSCYSAGGSIQGLCNANGNIRLLPNEDIASGSTIYIAGFWWA